jgi:Holliday junction resolvasome RuvABC endonuclease subunit
MKGAFEMSIAKLVNTVKSTRIISIDPSSNSLAWCVVDLSKNTFNVVANGKIDFSDKKEIGSKFKTIRSGLHSVWEDYLFKDAVIEQSVFIQNFQSSRIISYIIGYSWGTLDEYCNTVCDVNPLIWKNRIGYKNISKQDKLEMEKQFGSKGLQARLTRERKDRVKKIIEFKAGFSTEDDDINDAIGIALWYYLDRGYGAV